MTQKGNAAASRFGASKGPSRGVVLTVIGLMAFSAFAIAAPFMPASFGILPDSNCFGTAGISGTGTTTVSCTLTAVAGERFLVGITTGQNIGQGGGYKFAAPSDTLGSGTFGILVSLIQDYQKFGESEMFTSVVGGSGSDTVSAGCTLDTGGGGAGRCDMWVYEVPYVPGGGVSVGQGSCRNVASNNCLADLNGTVSPSSGWFVMAVGSGQESPQTTFTAGAGFTLDANSNGYGSGTFFGSAAEYIQSSGGSPTSAAFARSVSNLQTWTEVAAAVQVSGPSGGNIVQSKCALASAQPQLTGSVAVTLSNAVTAGNVIGAVLTITGSANTAITNANITDNQNVSVHYQLWIRATDQANTLFTGVYSLNNSKGSVGANSFTATAKYAQSPNTANQNMLMCVYEMSGLGVHYRISTHTVEGGGASLTTGAVGSVVLSGDAGNAGGGQLVFTGISDSGVLNTVSAAGHNQGTWSGLTGVTYNELADAGFSPAAPTTCVCTVVVAINITSTSFVVQNATTPFNWGALIGVILIIAVIALFYILRRGSSAGGPDV